MAADSVGQIGLDLVINQNGFQRQMSGLTSLAKKAGVALAGAFAVKKLVDFGAKCIELGSDLQEVQNVVNVTFPQMSKQVDEFAKNAAASFGLSETMAKKFTGTFGSMAKAFGFNEQAAYEMSTTLTGLAGDVASFYNLSQDEAYTKLKSVFTGETESLKDLGVVMTQAALDQYALANGFGKTTQSMSEAEKVSLRYKFVLDQLSSASGDFLRTSDGWANQVRVLKLQFDSLKATIGQGLINLLTPVLRVINMLLGKLAALANGFKAFTEFVTGKKSGVSDAASGMGALTGAASDATSAVEGTGEAAKKTAKAVKGVTTGIDELNIIKPDAGAAGESAPTGSAGGGAALGEAGPSAADEVDHKLQGLIDRMKELAALATKGFWDGFGDTAVFDSIRQSVGSIKDSLTEIFTAPEVLKAASDFADSLAYNLGRMAGAAASIGATIADNLLGGLRLYLEQNGSRIQDYLVSMLKIGSRAAEIKGDCATAVAEIFSVFRGDAAKQITADIIAIFSNGFMGVTQILAAFGADFLDMLTAPIIHNADGFQEALGGILGAVQDVTGAISETVSEFVDGAQEIYGGRARPLIESVKNGLSEIVGGFLEAFQVHILPVLQDAAARFQEFSSGALQPLIDKFQEFSGKVADALRMLWEGLLQPMISWIVQNVAPLIGSVLSSVWNLLFSFVESFAGIIDSILTVLSGLSDFILGVFTGNWSLAWEGIKGILAGAWEFMKSAVSMAITMIKAVIDTAWNYIKTKTTIIWTGIKTLLSGIWDALKTLASILFDAIKQVITAVWESVKEKTSEIWEAIKNTLSILWEKVKTTASNTFRAIKDAIVDAWKEVKDQTKQIWDGIWGIIKGVINSIIGGVEHMANRVIDGINGIIDGINDLVDPLADFVGLPSIPKLSRIKLPRLAEGGFVRANTPQLAMIGDNRHYGEIVAPEDKMQEMVNRAVAMASGQGSMSDQYLAAVTELLERIIELIEAFDLTVNIDVREIRRKLADLEKRSGYSMRNA